MTIRDYLDKNLSNINWNIFPQICEENGVELTDWMEQYLKETPENTNWNLLKSAFEKRVINFTSDWFHSDIMPPGSSWTNTIDALNDCINNVSAQPYVTLIVDGVQTNTDFYIVSMSDGSSGVRWEVNPQTAVLLTQNYISLDNGDNYAE